jgi:hypothetical protein
LCLTKHYTMKTYGGSGCIDPRFLDLSTSWRRVVSFTFRPLYPQERAPSTHWIGGWVGPRAGLDDMEKGKFLTLPGVELKSLGGSARSQSLYRLRCRGSYEIKFCLKIAVFWAVMPRGLPVRYQYFGGRVPNLLCHCSKTAVRASNVTNLFSLLIPLYERINQSFQVIRNYMYLVSFSYFSRESVTSC